MSDHETTPAQSPGRKRATPEEIIDAVRGHQGRLVSPRPTPYNVARAIGKAKLVPLDQVPPLMGDCQ